MSIRDIENAKTLRKYCEMLGREGVAKRIIEIASKIVSEEGAYQETLKLAGEIRALCVGVKFDHYWDEKQFMGFHRMLDEAEYKVKQKPYVTHK